MAGERRHLAHRRVAPHDDLVLAVAVRRDELVDVLGPAQVAHLAARVDARERRRGLRVPEADAPVGRAAARCEQAVLVRRPGDGLDRGGVLIKAQDWRRRVRRPDVQLVVVAARRKLLPVEGPAQAAHLVRVRARAKVRVRVRARVRLGLGLRSGSGLGSVVSGKGKGQG